MMMLWALDVSTLPLILDMGFVTKSSVGSSLPSLYSFLNSMFTCGALGCRTLVTTLVCMREWKPGNLPWCYKSVCVWMCVDMHMYVFTRGDQRMMLNVLLNHTLPYFLRQSLTLNLEFTNCSYWLASVFQESSVSSARLYLH